MKKLCAVLLVFVLLAGLCGCGASSSKSYNAAPSEAAAYDAAVYEPEEPALEKEVGGLGEINVQSPIDNTSRKLIYTAYYTVNSTSFVSDCNAITAAVEANGGYISNKNISGKEPLEYGDSGRTADLVARIPVAKYAAFCNTLHGIGEITSENSSVDDVSTTYYDAEARIEMLEGRYAKLEEHVKAATDMEDIITLESEMSDILYQLDILKGEKRHMDDQIDYSTVTINLREVVKAKDVVVSKKGAGERAGDAFAETMSSLGVVLEDCFVDLVAALPVIVFLAVIAGIIVGIVLLVRKGKKQKAKK